MRLTVLKKIFGSLPVFLAVFIIISMAADISFLSRKTTSQAEESGWRGMPDFKVFWQAGNVAVRKIFGKMEASGKERPLYDKEEPFYHFRYSPITAVAMAPFGAILYPRVSMMIWLILGNMVFLAALLMLAGYVKQKFFLDDISRALMLWVMFLGTLRYYLVVISQGQTDGLVAFLLVLLLISDMKGKDILSGILFACMLQIKPFFLLLGVYFLARKKYGALLSSGIFLFILVLMPSFFLGFSQTFELTKEWIHMVRMSVPSQVLNYKNQSLAYGAVVVLRRIAGTGKIVQPEGLVMFLSGVFSAIALSIFFFSLKFLKRRYKDLSGYVAISMAAAIPVLFSPISWEAYYMFLIIPLALVTAVGIISRNMKKLGFYLAGYFILTLSVGTDITKFIPFLNGFRYINVSIGTVFLLFGMFDILSEMPVFKEMRDLKKISIERAGSPYQ
ncbi:MAG: glycosyltransferase family 87 protein [Candidatus Omnitrophota bacterium]